jgi:hypothetical protein
VKLLALMLAAVAAGCGGESSIGSEPDFSEPAAMMLRLSDLPHGFRYGDARGCNEIGTTEGQKPELDKFLIEARPRTCFGDFSREWGGEPAIVRTALFLFDSDDDAGRAWAMRAALFRSFAGIYVTTPHGGGDQIAFDSRGALKRGAGEAWRDGHLVVAIYEEGLAGDPGREFAREIAEKQRHWIDSPSDPTVEDDREIGLEDPAIAIPVYWLGREFRPDGLPDLTLYNSEHLRDSGPGNEVKIDYEADGGGVTLDLWAPEEWRKFRATRLGRLFSTSRCASRSEVLVAGARAEIYGGRAGECGGEPNRWLANVHYRDVVVAVNMPYGTMSAATPGSGPYNSREGMEAVVRGLRRR